ncbi:MAG TPA: YegS/Rv2252/BmrU family lipid kinase [Clostridia bacterium]
MKKALIAYNPLSGNRNVPRELDYIVARFIRNDTLAVPFRLDPDNSSELEKVLLNENFDYVVVSGGDGTVNSIASVLLSNNMDIPIGVIPAGTCNDLARSLNIPTDMKKCLDTIFTGNITEIDTGFINGEKYFLNTCAGGVFVDVSYSTDSELKKRLGPLAYYMTALGELANVRPIRLKLTADEEVVEGEFLLFLILNGRHAAGFWNLVEEADLSDGYMDILLVKNCLHVEMAALFFKVLHNDFINDKNVMWLRTSKCRIEGDTGFNLSIDGEEWKGLPIDVEFRHKSLKVFTPVK